MANPAFPQEGGVTVGSVLNTNEWGVIDSLAAGAQSWVGSEGRETETRRETERDLHQADEVHPEARLHPGLPASAEHPVQLKSLQ